MDARSFTVSGQLTGFVIEDGYKLKAIKVLLDTVEYRIKLSKELRRSLPPDLVIGQTIQVSGWGKREKTGILKLTADVVQTGGAASAEPVTGSPPASTDVPADPEARTAKAKAKVLVCQKSGCLKRGGYAVCAALEEALRDRQLDGQVMVQGTGCMDRCKAGPNLVFMPDRARYSMIQADEIAALVEKHLLV
ncbi:MAG: (2Fe-2S) ferredoxin domain-containing protein [Synechococcales bacterium]|nr:(2Fe-2S) ferredoxin domain-containing protein [Synechococcales bacterium]